MHFFVFEKLNDLAQEDKQLYSYVTCVVCD